MPESIESLLLDEILDRLAVLGSGYLDAFAAGIGCERFFRDENRQITVLDELLDLPQHSPLLARAAIRGCLTGEDEAERAAAIRAIPFFQEVYPELVAEAYELLHDNSADA